MKKMFGVFFGIVLAMNVMAGWEPSNHIRTFDGDWIERGTTVDKLAKLNARREGTETVMFNGNWQTITYYSYKTYEANFRIKVIAGRVADIEWSRQ